MTIDPPLLPDTDDRATIVVAMSGGVDSSVVAGLLSRAGYNVIGITLQLYDHGEALHRKGACCAGQDIHDAQQVAQKLGIPHYVLDYERRFKDQVIEQFADSYLAGETPVPCISCNQTVKFTDLLQTARDLGADALATGHYIASRPETDGNWSMYRAADPDRDQSYFLYATTQEQLNFLRFPLGGLEKARVRDLAREFDLDIAEKSDSQDICFVPTGRYTSIVERLRPEAMTPGNIVDLDGNVMGKHSGIYQYTIGQRRGLGIASGEPLYVVRLSPETGEVVVGPREALEANEIVLRAFNWLGPDGVERVEDLECAVRVRSTQSPVPATLSRRDGEFVVSLHRPDTGISPGQACVVYENIEQQGRVFGGGVIKSAHRAPQCPQDAGVAVGEEARSERVA